MCMRFALQQCCHGDVTDPPCPTLRTRCRTLRSRTIRMAIGAHVMKLSRPVIGTYTQRIPTPSVYRRSTAGSIPGTTGEHFLARVTLNKLRILVEGLLRSILYPSMRPPRYPPMASAQQIRLAWPGT